MLYKGKSGNPAPFHQFVKFYAPRYFMNKLVSVPYVVDANEKVTDLEVGTIEILGATYARRSRFEKRKIFFFS
jgi:hypothetical protein